MRQTSPQTLRSDLFHSRRDSIVPLDSIYNGFSRAQLRSFGALESPYAKKSNLQNIHPLYARDKWETWLPRHLAFYPLGGEREGHWKADNEVVWNILKPCLALASQFIQNIHCSHWWSACVNADWERHPAAQSDLPLRRFRRHHLNYESDRRSIRLEDTWKRLGEILTFGICSAHCNPLNGMPSENIHEAITIVQDGQPKIYIPFERLAPLLENLSTSQRLVEQFNIAISFVHETAHAMCGFLAKEKNANEEVEPYFEEESLAEVGFSVTNAIMGGNVSPIAWQGNLASQEERLLPRLGMFLVEWPNFDTINPNSREPSLDPKLKTSPYNIFPITIDHISHLQQQKYWDNVVRTHGHQAVKAQVTERCRQFPSNNQIYPDGHLSISTSSYHAEHPNIYTKAQLIHAALQPPTASPPPPPTPPPQWDPRFTPLLQALQKHTTLLALDTQSWLPLPLFHAYLTNIPNLPTPTLPHLTTFLQTCHLTTSHFAYLPLGSGILHPLPSSFPPATRPNHARPLRDNGINLQRGFAKRLEMMWAAYQTHHIHGKGAVRDGGFGLWTLADIDCDVLYGIFLGGAPGEGIARRENFDVGMAWEVQRGVNWTYAPSGVYRRVRRRVEV